MNIYIFSTQRNWIHINVNPPPLFPPKKSHIACLDNIDPNFNRGGCTLQRPDYFTQARIQFNKMLRFDSKENWLDNLYYILKKG